MPQVSPNSARPRVRLYCIGCNSRMSTILANLFLLALTCFYTAASRIGLFDLSDDDDHQAPEKEKLYLKFVLTFTILQAIVSILAIYGACTYRVWPVRLSLGLVSINLFLTILGGIASSVVTKTAMQLFFVLGSILVQYSFFWIPMYGFTKECEELRARAFTVTTEEDQDLHHGGYTDESEELDLEMV